MHCTVSMTYSGVRSRGFENFPDVMVELRQIDGVKDTQTMIAVEY